MNWSSSSTTASSVNHHQLLPQHSPGSHGAEETLEAKRDVTSNSKRTNAFHQYCRPSTKSATRNHPPSNQKVLKSATVMISKFYLKCNPTFKYQPTKNPRRVLTDPPDRVHNDMNDNADLDLVICVNDELGPDLPDASNTKKYRDIQSDIPRHASNGIKEPNYPASYRVIDVLGKGTFGQVVKCEGQDGNIVAVKVIKNKDAYFNQALTEIRILLLLNNQDKDDNCNIIRLQHYFMHKKHLCLVFELLNIDLYSLMRQNKFNGLSCGLVRSFVTQCLQTLVVLRNCQIIHCDLKPENILLKNLTSPKIKVIDFGSACYEGHTVYTYIQSRFYRSPEVLLGLPYTCAIDMWSLGCIAAELFLGIPIFPGSDEFNQLCRIANLTRKFPDYLISRGSPDKINKYFNISDNGDGTKTFSLKPVSQYYDDIGEKQPVNKKYFHHNSLQELIDSYPYKSQTKEKIQGEMDVRVQLLDLLLRLLQADPEKRLTPKQALSHPFITGKAPIGEWTPEPDPPPPLLPSHPKYGDPRRRVREHRTGSLGQYSTRAMHRPQRQRSASLMHPGELESHYIARHSHATAHSPKGLAVTSGGSPHTSHMVIDSNTPSTTTSANSPATSSLQQQQSKLYYEMQMRQQQQQQQQQQHQEQTLHRKMLRSQQYRTHPPHSAPSSSSRTQVPASPTRPENMCISPYPPQTQHTTTPGTSAPSSMLRRSASDGKQQQRPMQYYQYQKQQMTKQLQQQLHMSHHQFTRQEAFQHQQHHPPHTGHASTSLGAGGVGIHGSPSGVHTRAPFSSHSVQSSPHQTRRMRSQSDSVYDGRAFPGMHQSNSVQMSVVQEQQHTTPPSTTFQHPPRKYSHKTSAFGTPDESSNPSSGSPNEWGEEPMTFPTGSQHIQNPPDLPASFSHQSSSHVGSTSLSQLSSLIAASRDHPSGDSSSAPKSQVGFEIASQSSGDMTSGMQGVSSRAGALGYQPGFMRSNSNEWQFQQGAEWGSPQAPYHHSQYSTVSSVGSMGSQGSMGSYPSAAHLQFSPPNRDFGHAPQNFLPHDARHRPLGITTGLTPQNSFMSGYQYSPTEMAHRRSFSGYNHLSSGLPPSGLSVVAQQQLAMQKQMLAGVGRPVGGQPGASQGVAFSQSPPQTHKSMPRRS